MTAVERLDEIEARGSELGDASSGLPERFAAAEHIAQLVAAVRAVLALCDAAMETDGYAREWGVVDQHRIRDAITAALDPS